MSQQPIGVCVFENPSAPEDAYISIGGAAATKIYGTNELTSGVLWITTLPYKKYQEARFYNSPNLKQSQYFRSSTDIILKELGLSKATPARQAQALSSLFSRTLRLGDELMGMPADKASQDYRYANLLRHSLMPDALKSYDSPDLLALVHEASQQATQSNQTMSGVVAPKGSTTYGFYFPRTEFARYLLGLPLPIKNDWREITFKSGQVEIGHHEGKIIQGTDETLRKLLKMGESRALILRVTVHKMDAFYQPFQTFGAGVNTPRSWATLPEVIELARYSRLSIAGGVSCALGHLDTLDGVFSQVDMEFSYSRGLLLENAWTSLTIGFGAMKANPLGAYLRAYDRILCSKAAAACARAGFTVGSFGTGRLTLYLRRGEVEEASRLAQSLGLIAGLRSIDEAML